LSLVNLLLLASLEERFIYEKFDYFLGAENEDGVERDNLVDKATRNRFALSWRTMTLPVEETLSYF